MDERVTKKIILFISSFILCFIFMETGLRLHFNLLDPIDQAKRMSVINTPLLGWDLRTDHEYKIADSSFYKVDKEGFRFSPKAHDKNRKTVLLIGDSFTHASHLANQDVYFHKLSDFNINFYSYGVVGWNNYQEVLKVKELISRISPDILIWQLSANDLIENVYEIEKRLGKKSFGRPYLDENGNVFYDSQVSIISRTRVLFNKSRTISFIFDRLHSTFENTERKIEFSLQEKEKSKKITSLIFKEMKTLIPPSSKIVVFNAGPLPFDQKLFKDIALNSGFIYLEEIEDTINLAKASGKPYFTPDAFHWTKEGHQFIQSLLTPKIKEFLEAK